MPHAGMLVGYSPEFLERVTIHSGLHITRCVANVDDGDNEHYGKSRFDSKLMFY